MRLIFAGTPGFAALALARLHACGHEIALVLTQPDRPAGRGLQPQPSAVKQVALQHGLALAQPRGLRLDGRHPDEAAAARAAIEAARADAMVVAAYGLILPQWVLEAPRLGCLNIHASLLPRWRGAAPIQRAIEAGDAETGVTIMQMDAGLDTGPMLLSQAVAIGPQESAGTLHDRLAGLGADLIVRALELAAQAALQPRAQPQAGVSYAHKIDKREAAIDWRQGAVQIERRLRAFDPQPGATTRLGALPLKVWRGVAEPAATDDDSAGPGTVLGADARGIRVVCGSNDGADGRSVLRVTELQRAGARRMAAADFLRGTAVAAGATFARPD